MRTSPLKSDARTGLWVCLAAALSAGLLASMLLAGIVLALQHVAA